MELGGDTKAVLAAAGLIFIGALLLGVWKYRQMAASPDGRAHPYVDVAHRAALLYSFAHVMPKTGWMGGFNPEVFVHVKKSQPRPVHTADRN